MPEDNKDIQQTDNLTETPENRLETLKGLVQSMYHNLDKVTRVLDKIQQEQRREIYKKMPGSEGVFDGTHLTLENGDKMEVPANYAAKSRLVFGDRLKVIEEDGKKVFKQIQKSERKEIQGVLSKKEGKWYLLAESGTYKISDVAAEFNKVELNEKAVGLVPLDNPNVPFAALDKVIREGEKAEELAKSDPHPVIKTPEAVKKTPATVTAPKKPYKKPEVKIETKPKPSISVPVVPAPKKVVPVIKASAPVAAPVVDDKSKKEFVANILEEDDLR